MGAGVYSGVPNKPAGMIIFSKKKIHPMQCALIRDSTFISIYNHLDIFKTFLSNDPKNMLFIRFLTWYVYSRRYNYLVFKKVLLGTLIQYNTFIRNTGVIWLIMSCSELLSAAECC